MIIFLDIDGVMRGLDAPPDRFETSCRMHFETVLREYPNVQVVISSTWRLEHSLDNLRNLFSPDIAPRVSGATPDLSNQSLNPRHAEVLAFLNSLTEKSSWIVIDDKPAFFPAGTPMVAPDPFVGFDGACADALRRLLKNV